MRRPNINTLLMSRSFGFTLIEMLVVVVIVSVLASIGLPMAEMAHRRAQEEELRHALREIRSALDAYKRRSDLGHIIRSVGDSGYPPDLSALVDGVVDIHSPTGEKIYFMRSLPRDPFAPADVRSAIDTWALRSYASPSTDPKPGRDVFDVHSKSREVGLNGTPYHTW